MSIILSAFKIDLIKFPKTATVRQVLVSSPFHSLGIKGTETFTDSSNIINAAPAIPEAPSGKVLSPSLSWCEALRTPSVWLSKLRGPSWMALLSAWGGEPWRGMLHKSQPHDPGALL